MAPPGSCSLGWPAPKPGQGSARRQALSAEVLSAPSGPARLAQAAEDLCKLTLTLAVVGTQSGQQSAVAAVSPRVESCFALKHQTHFFKTDK